MKTIKKEKRNYHYINIKITNFLNLVPKLKHNNEIYIINYSVSVYLNNNFQYRYNHENEK